MKHLFIILLCLPAIVHAQFDKKYLEGAVPVINGKVVFSQQIDAPSLSRDQIYEKALAWANQRFSTNENRVVYTNKEKGQIACVGEEDLVFSESFLTLDHSLASYRLTIECEPGKCLVEMGSIRYKYNVAYQKEPERYVAETWITDEVGLTKEKDKLAYNNGKFREKTIDLKENLINGILNAINAGTNATTPAAATLRPAQTAVPAALRTEARPAAKKLETPTTETTLNGYKKIAPDKIPGNVIKMLTEDWMLITAGDENQFNMMTASWGGLGHLFGKPVAFCFISPSRHTYRLMEKNDTYTLTFYTEAYRDALKYCGSHSGKDEDKVKASGLTPVSTPAGSKAFAEAWMIIECKKLVSQSLTPESIHDQKLREEWDGKALHKMFVGEIINVWIK